MLIDKHGKKLFRGDKVRVAYGFNGFVERFQGEDIVVDERKLMSFFFMEPQELEKII